MPKRRSFRVGLVGAGWIAADHLALLRRLGRDVVAVCDVDHDRAAAAAPPGARAYEDWQELLDRETLDALWVTTPPRHHRGPACAAMELGLPVWLEKPVARDLDDAAAIVETWRRTGAVCAVGYQWHASEGLEVMRAELRGRQLALLHGISIGPTEARPWFLERAGGGGNVLERGSHQLDLARAVAGEVVSVQAIASSVLLARAEAESGSGDIEDAAALSLRFESGAIGSIVLAWTSPGQPATYRLDAVCAAGALRLDLDPAFTVSGRLGGRDVHAAMTLHPFERGVTRFLAAARAGEPEQVACTPSDAAATLATALACERSLLAGGRVVELAEVLPQAAGP